MSEMTPEQALELLDKATSMLQLNRADHSAIAKALQTLNTLVAPPGPEMDRSSGDPPTEGQPDD